MRRNNGPRQFVMLAFALTVAGAGMGGAQPASSPKGWRAQVSANGEVELLRGRTLVAKITPGLFDATWTMGTLGARKGAAGNRTAAALGGMIKAPGGQIVDYELRATAEGGGVRLAYKLAPREAVSLNSLHVSVETPIDLVAGGEYVVDGKRGAIPAEAGQVHLRSGPARRVTLPTRGGEGFSLEFEAPTPVLIQDNRQWGPSLSVRIGPTAPTTSTESISSIASPEQQSQARLWKAGETLEIVFTVKTKEGLVMEQDTPVTIQAGPDWIPLSVELDVAPGSALDFSNMIQREPAGTRGWVIARPDGQFAFEKDPGTARRFYGVNFCFSAQFIGHDEAGRLAERLMRLGYNAVRIHHYEGELVDRSKGVSTAFKSDKLDQLDYFLAALKKRGIYVTTDLFVSRPVFAKEIWDGSAGDVGMDNFKMLVPVNDRAFENWKTFTRNLLTHVNPYTGLAYAKDPTLAWLSMINEGNFGNYLGKMDDRIKADWQKAWNAFLVHRYANRGALEKAWCGPVEDDPFAGAATLPKKAIDDTPQGRDLVVFLAETERAMFARMKAFLREEIGTRALLTNMNSWTNPIQYQAVRADFDYVDDHFYVDHPKFLEKEWRLPSRCDNKSPIAAGAPGGRQCAFTRLFDKPFTITEYNYAGPGRFRGVGGILTGCMAALQEWGGVWRFAYSHNRNNLFQPDAAGYFDVVSDPLNQAAERAALCLYLRGDMKPAPHAAVIAMAEDELMRAPKRAMSVAPPWQALALVTRVGTRVGGTVASSGKDSKGGKDAKDIKRGQEAKDGLPGDALVMPLGWGGEGGGAVEGEKAAARIDPYSATARTAIMDAMRARGWIKDIQTSLSQSRPEAPNPKSEISNLKSEIPIQSETGELLVDAARDVMVLNTPMTAGGYAPEGETIEAGAVSIAIERTDATVWVSSLDGKPIADSRRLIVTHLTDLQNTGAQFGEKARQTLLAWGKTPHLVRAGAAMVTLRTGRPGGATAKVWALATTGRRVGEVKAEARDGALIIPLNVAGPEGARMIYEVEIP